MGASSSRLRPLVLAALGVVFGDIGTSPLYALRECFHGTHGIDPARPHVLGVLSLIFWALIIVISIKYLLVVMRADNHGEGGILALMALVCSPERVRRPDRLRWILIMVGLFGAALLYGDGMITPAISVLSAVEGLEVATPLFTSYVIPATAVILISLFVLQPFGTARVGRLFGPVTLLWFTTIGLIGARWITQNPEVLLALSPHHAVAFFREAGLYAFVVMGAVFLVVTGGEALYADMGHFGRRPIRWAWFAIVLPGLMLNYLGQGALLLDHPELAGNPFFHLAPDWALYPLVALATAATIIASQAVITGSFSLTWQAVQLGYLPRLVVRHTSPREYGQIYIPRVNWALLFATLALVVGFRSSSALAAAYGVAVTTTMVITTILLAFAMRRLWRWSIPLTAAVTGFFLFVDLIFFGANIIKIPYGGWFPAVVGLAILTLMTTWRSGRQTLHDRLQEKGVTLDGLEEQMKREHPTRVKGTAVYLTGISNWAPPALLRSMRHLHVLHERIVLLTVQTSEQPRVAEADRIQMEEIGPGLCRIIARYGFMERPHVPRVLERCRARGLDVDPEQVTYILGLETLLPTERPGMALWREKLFAFMSRNAGRATAFFRIPADRVLEIGAQIEL